LWSGSENQFFGATVFRTLRPRTSCRPYKPRIAKRQITADVADREKIIDVALVDGSRVMSGSLVHWTSLPLYDP
jgi:hypothetical protein